jgi:hypothetical protein
MRRQLELDWRLTRLSLVAVRRDLRQSGRDVEPRDHLPARLSPLSGHHRRSAFFRADVVDHVTYGG